ncbi:MAG: hypothetical protein FIA91_08575 [Geobacter sp.]|nr:hypothetical protein [Geobacter sp.]
MKRALTMFALFLLPLLVISGCSSGGNSTSNTTGNLNVSAAFPVNGQSGKVGTAQLDTSTARIKVEVIPTSGVVWNSTDPNIPYYGSYTFTGLQTKNLTAASPSATFTNLPIGPVYVLITTFDANGVALDQVKASGTIVEGSNSLTATMLRGNWTFASPIALNKTMSADTTTLSGFGAVSPVGMSKTMFANQTTMRSNFQYYQENNFSYGSPVGTLFHGTFSNYTTGCRGPQVYTPASGYSTVSGWNSSTMCGGETYYINYFKGTANYNTLEGGQDLPLKPDMNYYPKGFWPGDKTNRYAFVMGNYSSSLKPSGTSGSNSTAFSDPSIATALQSNYTRVTGGSAMSGTVIESLTKWYSSSRRCYNGTTQVSCNQQMPKPVSKASASRPYKSALATALWKRMSGLGTAAADAQGCYRDLQVTSNYEYTFQQYMGIDPTTQQSIFANITEKTTDYEKLDACLNQFTASGAQATTADVAIANQITELFFGQY